MATITIKNKTWEIPESDSPCDQWRVYFDKLKKEFGHDNAKMIWLITWQKNGNLGCTTNTKFNTWLKRNEIDVSTAATRAVADVSQIGSNILGIGKGLTKAIQIGVPVTLGAVLLAILFMLFKTSRDSNLKDVATMATPAGRAAKLLK